MSAERIGELEAIAVATIVCPRCEAKAGQRCTAISGTGGTPQSTPHPHEPRLLAVRAAYALGWEDGDTGPTQTPAPLMTRELLDSIVRTGRDA